MKKIALAFTLSTSFFLQAQEEPPFLLTGHTIKMDPSTAETLNRTNNALKEMCETLGNSNHNIKVTLSITEQGAVNACGLIAVLGGVITLCQHTNDQKKQYITGGALTAFGTCLILGSQAIIRWMNYS